MRRTLGSADARNGRRVPMRLPAPMIMDPVVPADRRGERMSRCAGMPASRARRSRSRRRYNARLNDSRNEAMADLFENPMGLMGFEFVEFASPTPNVLEPVFEMLGFTQVAWHRSKDVALYRQGDINFIVNREPRQPRRVLRGRTRPVGLRDGVPRQGLAQGVHARAGAGRAADGHRPGPDGAAPARHQGASAARRCT